MSNTSQASQRITALLDENSFVEIGAKVTARATDFNLKQTKTPSDGVITGYGVIDGNLVYVYSQDASVLGGSVGEMHARKIAGLYDLASKTGAPVIGLIDSTGLRLQEATDALNGFGEIYRKQALASGVIPQITAVFGSCGGGLALIPGLTDFTFMESKKAVIGSFWKNLDQNNSIIMELNYEERFNPIFIDINDFQFLMPPIMLLPPYTKNSILRIQQDIVYGQTSVSEFPSNVMQAHLPYIEKENIVNVYPIFEIE